MTCHYCHTDPGHGPTGVWKGFLDKDMNIHVCMACRQVHYQAKSLTEYKGLYSEFPVMIHEKLENDHRKRIQ